MISPELARWLSGRRPEIPRSFLPLLLEVEGEGAGVVFPVPDAQAEGGAFAPPGGEGAQEGGEREAGGTLVGPLADLASSALAWAAKNPGRNREAAFRLLAGDAFLTYACEASLDSKDTGAVLADLLARLGARFS